MAATDFIDGVTIVDATWLNKHFGPSGHVHDGVDADGSAPLVNLYSHTTLGAHGELLLIEDAATNHQLELRNPSLNPLHMTLGLPSARVRGDLLFGPNAQSQDATATNVLNLTRRSVIGVSPTTDWRGLALGGFGDEKMVYQASGFSVRRASPDGTETNSSSGVNAGEATTLYQDNLLKVNGAAAFRTTGAVDLPTTSTQYNVAGATVSSDGRVRVTFNDNLPSGANVTVTASSISSNKGAELYTYSASQGFSGTGELNFYVYEHTMSTGAIRIVTPSSPPNIDVVITLQAA